MQDCSKVWVTSYLSLSPSHPSPLSSHNFHDHSNRRPVASSSIAWLRVIITGRCICHVSSDTIVYSSSFEYLSSDNANVLTQAFDQY